MKGLPRRIATLADLDVLRGFIGTGFDTPENRAAIRAMLEAIRATHQQYVFTRVLATEADRAGPEPQFRVLEVADEGGVVEWHEFELRESPHSRLAALGVSVTEIDALIDEVGA